MWTGHATLSSMLAMMILRIIPVVFHQFVMTILDEKPWWLRLLGVVAWGNLLGSFALQFIWQVSLVETLGVTIGIFVVSCVVYIVGILVENLRRKTPTTYDWISYAMMIFPVASIGEICYYLYTGDSDQLTGLFVAAACVGYALFAHVLLVRNEVKNDVEKRALEQQQRALERKPLYQQINAHFLFNTLNTISAYCKEEPAKADRAVNLLSQYMRRYTKLVDASDYVPFKEEVTLMDLYLDILNLRYEEEYTLVVDASFEDFLLPPLTLQTVVENAVIHGLHKFVNHGVIYVQTQRYGKIIEMIVSDNGCGFDMRAKCKGSGVGLQNLSRRLRIMGGDMEVDSLPGNGTRIIMHVPLQPHEEEEQGEIV
ncbi:histidine kinase [Bengtsoniella intestinalis]|uniref:sensor histidine kinase n=1 Tax=Bengtsoniella intestinalis TaxID=3073143 RepID=UPI00391F2709